MSPDSVQSGGYALSELKFARERWPNPSGAVLPVIVQKTDHNLIDEYLNAVTSLELEGNPGAEVAAAVSKLQ